MTDITLCSNYSCPIRKTCYLARAIPSEYMQAYCEFPYDEERNKCGYFVPIQKWHRILPEEIDIEN